MFERRPRVLTVPGYVTSDQTVQPEPLEVFVTVRWSDGLEEEARGWVLRWSGDVVFVRWYGGRFGGQHEDWLPAEQVRRVA